jgi:hypothetical protein
MARPKKKYHYIYKTTCNLNGKYYIGMHSTSNLEDGYIGSGKRLRYSIRKHGVENFTREILEFLDDRDSLAKREAEIVNEELINDPLCMNLKCGGTGGFSSEEHKIKCYKSGAKRMNEVIWADPEYIKRKIEQLKSLWLDQLYRDKIPHDGFKGKSHTESTKELMRNKAKERIGDKNSQFGTCWITNEIENRKIKRGDLIPDGWRLGRKIK